MKWDRTDSLGEESVFSHFNAQLVKFGAAPSQRELIYDNLNCFQRRNSLLKLFILTYIHISLVSNGLFVFFFDASHAIVLSILR